MDLLDHLRKEEGLRLKTYNCPAGYPTIGYGHRELPGEPVRVITLKQAEALLESDVAYARSQVEHYVKPEILAKLSANQKDALTAFVFNLGPAAFAGSTLLHKVNAGMFEAVPAELRRWVHARVQGVMIPLTGLIRRREHECSLWESDDNA